MRIIPVLDLKDGHVVRAERGDRKSYRPIVSPLCASSKPVDVADGLCTLHSFDTFYCADLDAIAGSSPNRQAIADLQTLAHPKMLWVDAGISTADTLSAALSAALWPVLGTESQKDEDLLRQARAHPRLILSLDFFADGYRGPKAILDRPDLWPATVIVMTLAKVGAASGPDLDRLRAVKHKAGDRAIIAAGGVRNGDDIRQLAALGIEGALVATCLHDGTLTPEDIAGFAA